MIIILLCHTGYIGEFEIIDDHRAGKIVVNLTGRLNKVNVFFVFTAKCFCVILGTLKNTDCVHITGPLG